MKRSPKVLEWILQVAIGLVLQILFAMLAVQYWQWFIQTSFEGAPDITPVQALAVMLTTSLLLPSPKVDDNWLYILQSGVRLIAALIVGAIFYILFFSAG